MSNGRGYDPRIMQMHRTADLFADLREERIEHSLLLVNIKKIAEQIAYILPREEYLAWWETTPDDDEGFYRAAVKKLAELRMVGREPEDKLFASCIQDTPKGTIA